MPLLSRFFGRPRFLGMRLRTELPLRHEGNTKTGNAGQRKQ
jgi:hypothetical protein